MLSDRILFSFPDAFAWVGREIMFNLASKDGSTRYGRFVKVEFAEIKQIVSYRFFFLYFRRIAQRKFMRDNEHKIIRIMPGFDSTYEFTRRYFSRCIVSMRQLV